VELTTTNIQANFKIEFFIILAVMYIVYNY
jgi:hypothetical protein